MGNRDNEKREESGFYVQWQSQSLHVGLFLSFVIKELKLLQACRWTDTPNPALHTDTHRVDTIQICVVGESRPKGAFWSLGGRERAWHGEGMQ